MNIRLGKSEGNIINTRKGEVNAMPNKIPNIMKGAQNAKIVRIRNDRRCLYCDKFLKKGIRARVYYINGLGPEYFCFQHHRDDIISAVMNLIS